MHNKDTKITNADLACQVIQFAKSLIKPDAFVAALTKKDWCIMDELYCHFPYKEHGGCPDYERCDCCDYMLACLSTRDPEQIADWVVTAYNEKC